MWFYICKLCSGAVLIYNVFKTWLKFILLGFPFFLVVLFVFNLLVLFLFVSVLMKLFRLNSCRE